MRKPKETVSDVSSLLEEWDFELNSQNGIFPQLLGSQSNTYAYWKCKYGHQWKAKINNRYNGRGCPECNKRRKTSFPEQAIFFYVKQVFPDAINSYTEIFKNRMEIDVYIPSIRVGIEYDGIAWHKEDVLWREKEKYKICRENSIKLFRVKENSFHENSETGDVIVLIKKFFSGNKDYIYLDDAIQKLLYFLSSKPIDIDTERDRNLIYENYIATKENASLQVVYPEIARQWHPVYNGRLTPLMFSPHSNIKVWWLGDCGHEWEVQIAVRTRGNGCPYCSGNRVLKGFNDLPTAFPEISKQWHPTKNKDKTPEMYTYGSGHRAFWLCPVCNQTWEARINMRTSNNRGCPYCSHELPITGVNDLVTVRPDLMLEWDYNKNANLDPTQLMPNSNKKVWWRCSRCGLEYQAYINNRNKGSGCRQCAGMIPIPGTNDLKTLYPEIAFEWDDENNGCSPTSVLPKSNKKFSWVCALGHRWTASPNSRVRGRGCPICSGNKVLEGFNDLQTTHPEIARQWHPTKNEGLIPTQISKGYDKKVWFICDSCHNAYESFIGNKIKGYGKCPFCSERKTRAKTVVQIETGRRFRTLKEAARSVGKEDIRQIQMCCKGRCKTAYGFHWKYSEE